MPEKKYIEIIPISWEWANSYFFKYWWKNNIIDAGYIDFDKLQHTLGENWKVDNLFFTHEHFDHIASIEKIIDLFPDIICHIHKDERIFLDNREYNLSAHFNEDFSLNERYFGNIRTFEDWSLIDGITIIHTPGHTSWWSCFYIEECGICFTWDTLFSNTYGRVDLKTWDINKMKSSLNRLFELPQDTIIYPGHMESEILWKIKIYL
jgi:glyoxylase-like metal-dependent hydrolase (beta-lactamase superfamily II)